MANLKATKSDNVKKTRVFTNVMLNEQKTTRNIDSLFWLEWQKHQEYLYRCCVKWMGGNSTNAEDALSMAMLKAREKIQQCSKTIENFKTNNINFGKKRLNGSVSALDSEEIIKLLRI